MAVGKERVGPISASDVEAYIVQGEVTSTSFVWCDGMDDWTALEAVPALSRLLPESNDEVFSAQTERTIFQRTMVSRATTTVCI